jgi:hypothetical protein
MASVRANQIAQQISALEEPEPTALLGRNVKVLILDFNVLRSSDLSIC